jgi:UDPglucose 6-dehydrogenase
LEIETEWERKLMYVTIIGTGYVGLTTGVTLAYLGHHVTCLDVDIGKIEKLSQGISPIYEPGLEDLMEFAKDQLTFTSVYEKAVSEADVIFLAVGTPPNQDGSPNLTYLNSAFETCVKYIMLRNRKILLVNKSTVPVGTAESFQQRLVFMGLQSRVAIASNPEFLRQGRAMHDTFYPDRIVVGGDETSVNILRELYSPIIEQSFVAPREIPRPDLLNKVPFIVVDRSSAELGKYAANAFLAMKISFINEMSTVCDKVGADVNNVAKIIGADPRIGPQFLQAGIGYGGSCFPKDTRALHHIAKTNGYSFKLMSAVIEVNNKQKYVIIEKLRDSLGPLKGRKIAVLGLTFKPETDDLRDAPSIPIVKTLIDEGAEVSVHDPIALESALPLMPIETNYSNSIEEVVACADAVAVLTEWDQYKRLNWIAVGALMRNKILVDGRNALDGNNLRDIGFEYYGIGRYSSTNKKQVREVTRLGAKETTVG